MRYDCVVVGSGHAGSCAALSAVQNGCKKVLIIDKCPPEWVGGNGYFTAGSHRAVHNGLKDLLPMVHNVPPSMADKIDVDPYTAEEFISDIMRVGNGQSDPALMNALVTSSRDALRWLSEYVKVPFILPFHRQAYEVNGRHKFWGGIAISVEDGGKGLIQAHRKALDREGVEVWFDTPAVRLLMEDKVVKGIVVSKDGEESVIETNAVILAAGGYEANAEMRVKHLGSGWDKAKVRGTPYNTGDGILMARDVGAKLAGDWAGCHSTCWDANAPDEGERNLTNQYTKSGYPLGIMVNVCGRRFVDEGEDYRNYTYAKFGRAILEQPEGVAFQIWDSRAIGALRKEEYGDGVTEKIVADTLEDLAAKLARKGLQDTKQFLQTLEEYNQAVSLHRVENPDSKADLAIKDGQSTQSTKMSLDVPKSNWASPIHEPPFMAVKVTCGITFTFGGLAIDPETAGVIAEADGKPIPGLFCTGEMVGGLFFLNYPGGSGLTGGVVFGRKAGYEAAKLAQH